MCGQSSLTFWKVRTADLQVGVWRAEGGFVPPCLYSRVPREAFLCWIQTWAKADEHKLCAETPTTLWSLLSVQDSEAAVTHCLSFFFFFSLAFAFCNSHSGEQHRLTLFIEPGCSWKKPFFVCVNRTRTLFRLTWGGFVVVCFCVVPVCAGAFKRQMYRRRSLGYSSKYRSCCRLPFFHLLPPLLSSLPIVHMHK